MSYINSQNRGDKSTSNTFIAEKNNREYTKKRNKAWKDDPKIITDLISKNQGNVIHQNAYKPHPLINKGNICYMNSTFQCINACLHATQFNYCQNIIDQYLYSLTQSLYVGSKFDEFLDFYAFKYSDFSMGNEFDAKEFYLRVLSLSEYRLKELFITKKNVSSNCLDCQSTFCTADSYALLNFDSILNFRRDYDNYFNIIRGNGLYFCLNCKKKRCELKETISHSKFLVIYFENHNIQTNFRNLNKLFSSKCLKIHAVIQRSIYGRNNSHFIAFIKINKKF